MKKYFSKNNKGFTLIELLVVISIIGILTTLVTANLTAAQARARDGRRKTDLKSVATGLEFFYNDNYVYPSPGSGTGKLDLRSGTQLVAASPGTNVYIKQIPKDPKNSSNNVYTYCVAANGKSFNLYAQLENTNDADRYCGTAGWSSTSCDAVTSNCDASPFDVNNANFTVTQPD
jgi:type II secretion system protein G